MIRASLMATLLVALSYPSIADASLHTVGAGDTIQLNFGNSYRQGSGGEFQVGYVGPNAPVANYFHTFCAEIGETISNNVVATVASIGLQSSNSLPVNTLTAGAAKLYRDYFDGISVNNYGFQGGPALNDFSLAGGSEIFRLAGSDAERAADGEAVQLALWKMIGEMIDVTGNAKANSLYNWYKDLGNDGNYYGVRIATLVDSNGNPLQDQFVVAPVPEATTIAIWSGLSMLGVGVAYRNRAKNA